MKANDQKTISIMEKPEPTFWSADKLAANNMSLSSIQVGELIYLGAGPETMQTNSSAPSYLRIGEVSNKTADGITIDISYPSIDVTVESINAASSRFPLFFDFFQFNGVGPGPHKNRG